MRLTARIMKNVANVNQWQWANQAYVYEGQPNDIYFQIVNLSKTPEIDPSNTTFPDCPMRYLSQATTLAVCLQFDSIDDSEQFEVVATQPFTDDRSIWKVTLTSAQLPKSGNAKLKLVEDGVEKIYLSINVIKTELREPGAC